MKNPNYYPGKKLGTGRWILTCAMVASLLPAPARAVEVAQKMVLKSADLPNLPGGIEADPENRASG